MGAVKHKTSPIQVCVSSIVLSIAFGCFGTAFQRLSAQKASGTTYSSKRMEDGKRWMTHNLDVDTVPSYCYEDAELNCRRYGHLYTWESARRICQSLGGGWRLPTDDEWRQMAKHYGGVSDDSDDRGQAAYTALLAGGSSGFNALLGGGRSNGQYARLEAHGSTGQHQRLTRPMDGSTTLVEADELSIVKAVREKQDAFSVRCITE